MEDGWAYVALWFGVRTCNWDLRNVALKGLVALLRGWDRTFYQREIPLHLAHLMQWPRHVLDALKAGLWTISVTRAPFRSLALDEAHEQLINRDLKMSLSRPLDPKVYS